jgi:hypothetical protein
MRIVRLVGLPESDFLDRVFRIDAFGPAATLLNMPWSWRMQARRWGSAVAIAVLLAVVAIAVLSMSSFRRPAQADSSAYQQQLQALERAWNEGAQARLLLRSKKLPTNAQECSKMYRATEASKFEWDNEDLVAAGQDFFNQGCFGVGDRAPAELLAASNRRE